MLNSLREKWKTIVLVLLGVALIGAGGWYYFRGSKPATTEASSVAARMGRIRETVSATGTIQPLVTKRVIPKVNGTLTKINYANGQLVKKGELMYELDSSSVQEELARARMDLQLAEMDYGTTSDQNRQQQVFAPISGQVALLELAAGSDIQKNGVLLIVENHSQAIFNAQFSEAQVKSVKVGQKVEVTVEDIMTTLSGKVQKVDKTGTETDAGTKSYSVTVAIPNNGSLAPGMIAQADVQAGNTLLHNLTPGQLEWSAAVAVRAGVSGTVKKLYVEEGSYVKAGQKLAELGVDSIATQVATSDLKVQQARYTVASLEKKLEDYKVFAPIDGEINMDATQKLLQAGDEASPGQALATVISKNNMTVTVPVDEVDIAKVKEGQAVTVTVDALPNKSFKGSVIDVATQGTEENSVANFDVTVQIADPENLKPMMTANVEILVAEKDNTLLVPIEAVQEVQGRKFVILAAGSGDSRPTSSSRSRSGSGVRADGEAGTGSQALQNQRALMKRVETGLYDETDIEIISGLKEGDQVTLPTVAPSANGGMRFPGMGGGAARMNGGGGDRAGGNAHPD
ncbi:MAG TPA: HlyD family efflux transporter periplasmic adaptor subunit [Bacillota bacterium]|nr:HlyD family efflux transporter periplasmic adaptor subunit [Bacillota bacterium]